MFDLRRFREDNNIKQKYLAEKLGVVASFISQIENGKDTMPDALFSKLENIYSSIDFSKYFTEKTSLKSEFEVQTVDRLLGLLCEKDRQIDRLLTLLEKK